jgi:hypothetical protein
MSFPSNERLFTLYKCVAEQLNEEQIEILLRRAGTDPSEQEIKDVRYRLREIINTYVTDHQDDA